MINMMIGKNGLNKKKIECVNIEILFQVIDKFELFIITIMQ